MKRKKNRVIIAIIAIVLLIAFGAYYINYHYGNYFGSGLVSIKTPPAQAKIMKDNYSKGVVKEILDQYTGKKIEHNIDCYRHLIENAPAGTENVRVHFIQLTDLFIKKYKILSDYNGKLYLAFEYIDKDKNRLGKPFLFDENSKLHEIEEDFGSTVDAYLNNINYKITEAIKKDNTKYIIITLASLKDHLKNITVKKGIILEPASVEFDLTEEYNPDDSTCNKQLTFFTNIRSNSGGYIDDLSEYNMNSLCPNQCP